MHENYDGLRNAKYVKNCQVISATYCSGEFPDTKLTTTVVLIVSKDHILVSQKCILTKYTNFLNEPRYTSTYDTSGHSAPVLLMNTSLVTDKISAVQIWHGPHRPDLKMLLTTRQDR